MMQINAPKIRGAVGGEPTSAANPGAPGESLGFNRTGWKRRSAAGLCEEARGAGAEERVS
jgi:hypothetical protein